jgi:zinc/manganese transport system substrate-binding protein
MKKLAPLLLPLLAAGSLVAAPARAAPPPIVAGENMYGDVAGQIAGPGAPVTSILSNPDQDPHLFEASPSVARAVSGARIVIENGADYDPWMDKLLAAARGSQRQVIAVAALLHAAPGANPHLWYRADAMPALARALADALAAADPAGRPGYEKRRDAFLASLTPIAQKVAALRAKYAGMPVTATEPVFGYMAEALGLTMRNERFQLAVMNDTEPSAADVRAMEDDLRQRRVKLFIYNRQASDAAAERLLGIARAAGIPVLGVAETEPAGKTYQQWILGELDALDQALAK